MQHEIFFPGIAIMFVRSKSHALWGSLLCIASFTPTALLAHNVQTDGTVGATFHIEPNHNPKAGEPATAWFALTTSGGEPLPFSQCDCQLAIYNRTVNPDTPILRPPLEAIVAEQYRDIPGAKIIFPEAGIYELALSGSPTADAEFEPFSLTYSVTVSPGKPVETPAASAPSATPNPKNERPRKGQWYWGSLGMATLIGLSVLLIFHRQKKS